MKGALFRAPVGYVCFDDRCVIQSVNEEACRLLGYEAEELQGSPLNRVLARPARIFFQTQVLPVLAQNERIEEAYLALLTKQGEKLPVLLNADRHESEGSLENNCVFMPMRRRQLFEGELLAAQAAAEEARRSEEAALDRIRAMQRKLALQERMATLGTLAAGVVHEINNALGYISGNLQLIEEELDSQPPNVAQLRAMLQDPREGMQHITTLIRSLRMYSRMEEERRVPVHMEQVIAASMRMTAHQIRERAQVELDLQTPPAVVAGDEPRLTQVVVNLLLNAAQAFPTPAPQKNRIWVRLKNLPKSAALLEIADNGPGIPRELQSRIFEPFFTTKPVGQGTGLGLAICHDIVTSLGGDLKLSSDPGNGACFQIQLPISSSSGHS